MKYAREFYDCPTLKYVPLENDGGLGSKGSHLERSFFWNENMTASDYKDTQFSGFGFMLLKDSGWYGINESDFENFRAGKGKGCAFYELCWNKANSN